MAAILIFTAKKSSVLIRFYFTVRNISHRWPHLVRLIIRPVS